jgi:heme/copper-type cytochrome/quinol oxidase subunit 1
LLWAGAAVAVIVLGQVPLAAFANADALQDTYYVVKHPGRSFGLAGIFLGFAVLYAALELSGWVRYSRRLAYAQLALALFSVGLIESPEFTLNWVGWPSRGTDPVASFNLLSNIQLAGYCVSIASLALFALLVVDALLRRFRK